MKRAIVFGCGQGYLDEKEILQRENNIIAFADNNPEKVGTVKDELPVIAPSEIPKYHPDMIIIGVYKGASEIKEQCLKLGLKDVVYYKAGRPARVFLNQTIPVRDDDWFEMPEDYTTPGTEHFLNNRSERDDPAFHEKLEDLKKKCMELNIPISRVAVTSGAVYQAYGLRTSKMFDDVDVIMTSDYRELYGEGLVIISDTCEMHPMNELTILDDEIIMDKSYHFVYKGLKFVNLKILRDSSQ